jgi:pimeloyl-ACP methyl ester carboxylesterase
MRLPTSIPRVPGLPRVPRAPAAVAAGAVAIAGASLAAERRHLRSLARDPELARLAAAPAGRPLPARSADGTALHAEAFGPEDGPTVVLAHGWTERLTFWSPVIARLTAAGLRAVAYDLRGHGRSAPAESGDYALARFGEDLEAVLAVATGDGQPVTVAGHSLGAMSIAAWAEHHDVGARAGAAALVNTGLGDLIAGHLVLGERIAALHRPRTAIAVFGAAAPIPHLSTPLSQALIRYIAFGPDATAGAVAFYERMLHDCPPDVRSACFIAMAEMDLWHAVARLTVPTLVVAGELDRLTPPAQAKRIAGSLPDLTELKVLPRSGHMSPLERPAEVAAALTALATAPR